MKFVIVTKKLAKYDIGQSKCNQFSFVSCIKLQMLLPYWAKLLSFIVVYFNGSMLD